MQGKAYQPIHLSNSSFSSVYLHYLLIRLWQNSTQNNVTINMMPFIKSGQTTIYSCCSFSDWFRIPDGKIMFDVKCMQVLTHSNKTTTKLHKFTFLVQTESILNAHASIVFEMSLMSSASCRPQGESGFQRVYFSQTVGCLCSHAVPNVLYLCFSDLRCILSR